MSIASLAYRRRWPAGLPDGPGDPLPQTHAHEFSRQSRRWPAGLPDGPGDPPPRLHEVVTSLIEAVGVIIATAAMTNKEAAEKISKGAAQSIADDIDFVCGTRGPYPPGPTPWWLVTQVASDVTLAASALSEGPLQSELFRVAGQLLDKAAAQTTGRAQSEA